MDGSSLLGAARGEASALQDFAERPQAFGRILFSDDSWGVLLQGHKWVSSGLKESLFNLSIDPGEDSNLLANQDLDTQIYLDALASRLGRPVSRVWRADAYGEHVYIEPHRAQLWFSHPEGIGEAWTRWDPMAKRTSAHFENGRVGLYRDTDRRSPRELFIEPGSSPVGAVLELQIGEDSYREVLSAEAFESWLPGEALLQIGPRHLPAHLGWTVQPAPLHQQQSALSADVEAVLEAMGYLE
jgi:hypothetical protein